MIVVRRVLALTVLFALVAPASANADGALTLGARAVARGYQVRGSDGFTVPRRRITQLLSLRAWAGPKAAQPVATGVLDLRLDTDLGLDPEFAGRLYDDSAAFAAADLRLAYVEVHDVGDVLDLTLGRLLYIGPDAIERLDGGRILLRSPTGWFTSARAGALVTPSSPLSQDPAFGGFFADRASPGPGKRPATIGGSVGYDGAAVQVTLAARRLTAGPDPAKGGDLLGETTGISLRALPTDTTEILLDGAWDLARRRVSRGSADVRLEILDGVGAGAGVSIWRPDFWLGSVWDVFGARPYTAVRTHSSAAFSPGAGLLTLQATADARSYGAEQGTGTPWFDSDADGLSYGGRTQAGWRWRRRPATWFTNWKADLWLRAEDGIGGLILFGGVGTGMDIVHERLAVGVRAYGLRSEPELQLFQAGTSGAVALDVHSRLGPHGHVLVTVEGLSNAPYLYELRGFLSYEIRYDIVDPDPPLSRFLVSRGPLP